MTCTLKPRFATEPEVRPYFTRNCGDGIAIDSIYECPICNGWHAETHMKAHPGAHHISEAAMATNAWLSRDGFKLSGRKMFR